jgi:uncharacterized BrkB/YihY/UPF0761 family membrane protein
MPALEEMNHISATGADKSSEQNADGIKHMASFLFGAVMITLFSLLFSYLPNVKGEPRPQLARGVRKHDT